MAGNATVVDVPFPTGGVDRSQPEGKQPPETCFDALNAIAYPALANRYTIGSVPGTRKALTIAAGGGGGGKRVNHLAVVKRIPKPAQTTDGTLAPIVDDLSQYGPSANLPVDFAGNYTGCYRDDTNGEVRCLTENMFYTRPAYYARLPSWGVLPAALVANVNREPVAAIAYPIKNDVKVVMQAQTSLASGATNTLYHPTYVGPFIRGSNNLQKMVVAYLEWLGFQHTCRLVIEWLDGATSQVLAASPAMSLRGVVADLLPNCSIRLFEDTVNAKLRAELNWPGALAGGGTATQVVTVTSALGAGNTRGGMIYRASRLPTAGYNRAVHEREVRSMEFQRREPYAYPSIARLMAAETDPVGGQPVVIPAGFRSGSSTFVTAVPPTVLGPSGVAAATATEVRANTTTDLLVCTNNFNRNTRQSIIALDVGAGGDTWGVDCHYRRIAAGRDDLNPVLRLTADHKYFLRVELDRTINTVSQDHSTSEYTAVTIAAIHDNAGVRTRAVIETVSFTGAGAAAPVFSINHAVRWSYEVAAGVGYVRARQNGVLLFEHAVTTDAQWAGAVAATTYGDMVGVDVSNASGATVSEGRGLEVINLSPVLAAAVPAGTDIAVFTPGLIEVGQLATPGVLNPVLGGGFAGRVVQHGLIDGKLYCVDGLVSRVLDPVLLTLEPWLNVADSDLDKCPLCCVWRGRMVIARPPSNPSMWFMSAVKQPTNFLFGDLSLGAARAFTGNNAEVGQPGDDIEALIPHSADYLIFACSNSFWLMRGDPGFGGRVDRLISETGILGARAWCYDEAENLYVMTTAGLMVVPKGGLNFTPVSGNRWSDLFRAIDPAVTDVQLGFDAAKGHVHIYLTPIDGLSAGTHIIYVVAKNAFWPFKMPILHGPSATAPIRGAAQDDRRLLIGGLDGLVRRWDDTAASFDGDEIEWYLRFAPDLSAAGYRNLVADFIEADGSTGNGTVEWLWLATESAQQVNANLIEQAKARGTWTGSGRQRGTSLRISSRAHQLVLRGKSTTERHSIDAIRVAVSDGGKGR